MLFIHASRIALLYLSAKFPARLIMKSFSSSANSKRAVVIYRRNGGRLGGLSLPSNSLVGLTGRPDMNVAFYRDRKARTQNDKITAKLICFYTYELKSIAIFGCKISGHILS